MTYYLGIEVNQREDEIFISQGYAREIVKKFKMNNSKPINTPVECGVKLSKNDGEKVDPTLVKSLVGSLQSLTCTRPDILYVVVLLSRYMKAPTTTYFTIAKRILCYIKGTTNFGLLYSSSINFKLKGYSESDWGGDIGRSLVTAASLGGRALASATCMQERGSQSHRRQNGRFYSSPVNFMSNFPFDAAPVNPIRPSTNTTFPAWQHRPNVLSGLHLVPSSPSLSGAQWILTEKAWFLTSTFDNS
ncbi:hypothetical protein ZIOFF_026717 [Zingiber officinale]|uniref:Mitochondrial protein n=1 Tax=Zingiber officinale TaxID=94328 RepID=A0A8J5GZI5_ZINOF|nr:hypothetical protein ZIOFF_026717 [Zingiber officinale]